jgi:hypothetical protein
MKKIFTILFTGLFVSPFVLAGVVYEDYEAYYYTMPGIFRTKASFAVNGSQNAVVQWQHQRIELKRATPFVGESAVNDDLGRHAVAFEKYPYGCVEGQSSSASGTAVRHKSVYLLDARATGKVKTYKLPSLFASCAAVRLNEEGQPLFDDANYLYAEGSDTPAGMQLTEYVISQGRFAPTGHAVTTRFVEPGNVWKFEVVTAK